MRCMEISKQEAAPCRRLVSIPCVRGSGVQQRNEIDGKKWWRLRVQQHHCAYKDRNLDIRVVVTETAERSQSIDKLPLVKRSASSRSQAELRALLTRLIGSLAAAQGTRCVERVAIDRRSAISGVWHLSCRTARQRCAERQVPCPTSNQGGRSCTICWSRPS